MGTLLQVLKLFVKHFHIDMNNTNIEEFTIREWSVIYTDENLITSEYFFTTEDKAREFKYILKIKDYVVDRAKAIRKISGISKVSIFKNEVSLNLPITGIKSIYKTFSH